MSIYYVYIYRDPITNIPFYVGYGKNKRSTDHLNEAKKFPVPKSGEHKLNKIRKLLKNGIQPNIEIIDSNLEKNVAIELEIFLIEIIGTSYDNTGPLTNMTKGGDGGNTAHSDNFKSGMELHHKTREKSTYATYGMKNKQQSNYQKTRTSQSNSCRVFCQGIIYKSVGEAQKSYPGIKLVRRLDSEKYPDFYRLDPKIKRS